MSFQINYIVKELALDNITVTPDEVQRIIDGNDEGIDEDVVYLVNDILMMEFPDGE